MRMFAKTRAIALGLGIAFAATACAGGAGAADTAPAAPAPAPVTAPETTATNEPVSLTIAVSEGGLVESNNPWFASSARQFGYVFVTTEPLFIFNQLDPENLTPWLATDFQWNDDFTTVAITAREGVTWSDGVPFSADDIAYTFELIAAADGIPTGNRPIATEVVGNVAYITYERPVIVAPGAPMQTMIVPKHFLENYIPPNPSADWNGEPGDPNEIAASTLLDMPGTGPFVKTVFTPHAVTLEARDDWWGGDLAIDTLHFVSYQNNQAVQNALQTGAADWFQGMLPGQRDLVANTAHLSDWGASALDTDVLFVNHTRAPFDSLAFRQAMNMVIDRDIHATIVHEGRVQPLASVTGLSPVTGERFIAPQFVGQNFTVDAEGARSVLADAGYTWNAAGALLDPNGEPVSFGISVPPDWHDFVNMAELVTHQARTLLGVDAYLDLMDWGQLWGYRAEGNFQATISAVAPEARSPFTPFQQTMGTEISAPLGEMAAWNWGRFSNADADAAIEQYMSTDPAVRQAAVERLQEIYVEQVPVLPLGARPLNSVFNSGRFSGWPSDDNPYAPNQTLQHTVLLVLTNLTVN